MAYKFVGLTLSAPSNTLIKVAKNRRNLARCRAISTSRLNLQSEQKKVSPVTDHAQRIESVIKLSKENLGKINYEKLLEPYYGTCKVPHKSIYPDLIDSYNYWMNVSPEKVHLVQEICEIINDQTNLVDDLLNQSDYRYGAPSGQRIYGKQRTWLSTIGLILLTVRKIGALDQPKALKAFYVNYLRLCNANSKKFDRINNAICPTVEVAMKIGVEKIGAYYSIISDIMQSLSDCEKDFTRLNMLFGIYLKSMHDYVSLSRDSKEKDIIFAEDLSEGRYKLPVVFATQKQSLESSKILNLIRQKTKDVDLKYFCVDLIEQLGGIEETKALEAEVKRLLIEEVDRLGGNPKMVKTIDKLYLWKCDKIFPNNPMYNDF